MTEKRIYIFVLITLLIAPLSYGQHPDTKSVKDRKVSYQNALEKIEAFFSDTIDFSKGVFLVEQTYYGSDITYAEFEKSIDSLTELVRQHLDVQHVKKYNQPDSLNYLKNFSIFSTLFNTLNVVFEDSAFRLEIPPFSYEQEDPLGKQDWTNMFVTKLLQTRKGNCHSLTYLYKMVADKIGAKCWLALAPNHIYIKNFSQYLGWYNTELTSRSFPTDAWIMTTSYIHPNAVRRGLYMDTLSNQQSLALCVLDLAKGYESQTHNYYDGFILQCCDLALQYHPVNPMALLLKAETLRKVYDLENREKKPGAVETYKQMEAAYVTLAKLYYREMPEKMYLQWLNTARNYGNKNIK